MFTLIQPPGTMLPSVEIDSAAAGGAAGLDAGSAGIDKQPLDEFIQAIRLGLRAQAFLMMQESPELVRTVDKSGRLAVHYAAEKGDVHMLQTLQDFKVDLQAGTANDEQMTPMHIAAFEGKISSMRYLLDNAGGHVADVQDASGFTPLVYAVKNHQADAVVFLLKVRASYMHPLHDSLFFD
jgi:ankyrin repeat protein